MTYLSPTELVAAAPAAQKMPKVKDGLIDTHAFIQYIAKHLGHQPVMAVQGKPHNEKGVSRVQRERQGRHLIVCANRMGNATILLNSHTVRRKAWIAAGFYREPNLVLVGVALPLQRWRGFGPAIEELERYRAMLSETRSLMRAYTQFSISQLATKISANAYLPGHNPIHPEVLAAVNKSDLWATLFAMQALMLKGNLTSAELGKRKVKPINGPDARMQAGNAMFTAGVDMLGSTLALPVYRKT